MSGSRFATVPVRAATVLAVAAAVAYSSWLLEFVLPDGVDPLRSYASELAARTEPHGDLFALMDTLSGGLLVLLGLVLWFGVGVRGRLLPLGLVVWGAATVADSIFRMPTVTTVGPGSATALSEADKAAVMAHSACSSAAAVGMALVGVGVWLLVPRLRWLAAVFLALLGAVAVTSGLHEIGGPNLWLGLWQRLSLVAAAAVLVVAVPAVTAAAVRREAS
ncbi:DUF998 domain-containing protein [uncultured Corynebacterium sp.]|uniref:DUF998 domain-containing protein n=1 Tax=uncultured Corynebacterium sp. TaxID=159447 RepID=UPI0025EC2831|nr:DUF998 domain-containing protein [uncultured Corynebacterium sp.]